MLSCVEFTVTMDAKDLRTESALSERNNDGSKYSQSGGIAIQCNRNKSYQDIGSNSLAKVDVQSSRPCAVIGPDRVVLPPAPSEAYLKKGSVEPWPCMDNAYHTRRPPEYPQLKLASFQNPTRNISPRQTFQENMQRIMVPPSYNSVKISDDNYVQMSDRSNTLPKNIKINVPPEAKFCDVPYTVYPNSNEQKNLRMPEMCMPSVNPTLSRTAPHGWPPGSVNVRPTRTYGAPELFQYPDYSSCAGPRPVVPRPNRTVPEESGYVYANPFYHQEGNIRFKPYPTVKDRFSQQRYEYIGNYPNSFHPPPTFPTHKYELQKTVPPHHYPPYPPIKYMDRVPEPVVEGYQRNQQVGFNIPYRNQIIHPNYGPVIGNCPQNKIHSYPPDAHIKTVPQNKLSFDNNKAYIEYENGQPKVYAPSESYLVNEISKMHPMKSQVIMPNYPTLNMHNTSQNPYFKKDSQQMKNYEYIHYRNMDPNIHNPMVRHPPVFSPNTSAISPTDSSASNDTSQTLGTSQEDCGYVSQSSTASVRSMDSGINRTPNDFYRKYYDSRFGPIIRTAPVMSKTELNSKNSKEKKNLDVRQFLQMWNEGDEEAEENHSKNITAQAGLKSDNNFGKSHEVINQPNQEQLYVLGLVNVPSDELAKYEHIQKVSKLPENIKGYNHIELLNQFEEAIEFSNMTHYKSFTPKDFQIPSKAVPPKQTTGIVPPRPISPLDVEAKISQSVIHKEVGCNFEIKPCSPKMLNVEIATPVKNILAERSIEKVANPVMLKSPRINGIDENIDCNIMKRKDLRMNMTNESARVQSCKMVNAQFSNNNIDLIKTSYSLQDLESNSGLCLASLPRLDNDIELNFPEVNQQFINANKGESSVASAVKDLPSLELLDNSDSQIDKLNDINQTSDVLKSPCIIDSEKEFTKLSKFRKSKSHSSDSKENQTNHVINAARTDSVIIKNPENIKNYEEKSIFSPSCSNKQTEEIQQVPINLTAQGIIAVDTSAIIKPNDSSEEKDTSIDIAIDFSLNKNSSNESIECIVKNDKSSERFTDKTIETNQSMVDDHLNKLSSFSACDEHIQDTLTDHNKIEDNFIPSTIKYDVREIVPKIRTDKICKEKPILENPPLGEILLQNECSSATPGVNQTRDEDDSSLTAVPVIETNDVISDSLLSIEFESPVVELLRTANCDDADSQMDIDKDSDIARVNLEKPDTSIAKDSLDNNVKNQQEFSIVAAATIENVKVFDNDYADVSAVKKAVTDPELNIEATQNNNVGRSTVSSVNIGSDSNNSYFTNNETFDNNVTQTENTKQKADLDFDLPSPNIVAHSEDNKVENTKEESEFNLLSCNNGMSPNCDRSKVNKPEADFKNNTPLSNQNVATYSPKDYKSDKVQENTDFNLSSHSINPLTPNREVCQLEIFERETDFNLASPHNMAPSSPKDYEEEITKEESILNIYSLSSSNNTIYSPKNNLLDFTESKESYLPDKSDYDVTVTNDSCGLSQDVSSYKIDLPTTEKCFEDIVHNKEEELVAQTLESPLKEEIDHLIRQTKTFLSYGSKEMYSPWIQKLIMYCEGSTKNINLKAVDDISTTCSSTKSNIMDVSNRSVSCLEEEKDTVFNDTDSSLNFCNSETTKLSDTLTIEECSNVEIDNTNNEEVKNAKNKNYNISDDDELSNTSMSQKNDIFNFLVENAQYVAHDQTNETSANLSEINDQLCDKLDSQSDRSPNTSETVSCICSKANQQSSKHCDCSNDTNNQLGKKYDNNGDVTNLCDKPCYSNDAIIKQTDIESNHIDEKNESWDKKSCNSDVSEEWDKQPNCNDEVIKDWYNESEHNIDTPEPWDKQSTTGDKSPRQWDEQPNCSKETPVQWDKQSNCSNQKPEQWAKESNCSNSKPEQWDKRSNCSDDNPDQLNKQANCSDDKRDQADEQSNCSDDTPKQWDKEFNCSDDKSESYKRNNCNDEAPERWDKQTNVDEKKTEHSDRQPDSHDSNSNELKSSTILENNENVSTKVDTIGHDFINKKPQPLKRSLSDSALNIYSNNENAPQEKQENLQFIWPFKRRKINNIHNDILAQNLCNIIQNNRRNSISTMYNEENVSFCILIDNDCIITEEENDEQEKMCYTELPEECLAQIQNDCTKDEEEEHVESMTEVISILQHESDCDYSDSFVMQSENEKLEESWVEDVACVETVISDDVAEDIEVCGPSSPKDDSLSENDESGVFSSSEHTDKVKYIYGDKMCNDDAQFVETLYNTPQMDVNKTLVQRVNQISGEYYDNDSLEKILSESNEPALSPYVPEYTEPVYSPGLMDVKETVANKENMDIGVISPLQSKANSLHFVDMNIHNIDHENVTLGQLFDETQDDTVYSCESSVDNVFTYKQNDQNTNYTTSSSPEVSSTTSEEKNSSILLKITSCKGSRISQINSVNTDKPSCKFTEDKDYVQSDSNFPSHRPLLTKAAQKYIPPLKESMRDLKVKLSLPQHSLMKFKQLKISKDEPKVCKPNVSVPKTPKKPKPKFEDVLKSIDDIQIKMHKEKTKKSKKYIPKVVIKKNENGSHYASTSNKDEFNPDLTGRKWQPWVFIEKNHFIDKMAIKKKTKAVFSHRKRTYVLAEKFQKYKSVNSAKFVISPPISDCPSTGLKYTIRLKHNY